ncbi:MAG: hypothetical protein GX846_04040 [Deltaproteobacteria bacterium]|nr:hypothetical protein [Deltaproteobacteria bacterium]
MYSAIGGAIAFILGVVFLYFWGYSFLTVLKGVLPVLFIMGGGLAVYLGIEEMKDKSASGSTNNEDTASLKNEVESLKEELRELKSEKTKSGDAE